MTAEPAVVEAVAEVLTGAGAPAAQSRRVPLAEQLARNIEPVDWAALWMEEHVEAEWLVEPIVPRGRQVAAYSPAKLGKSLLMLDIAAAKAMSAFK